MTDNETIKSRGDLEQEEIDREDNADLIAEAIALCEYEIEAIRKFEVMTKINTAGTGFVQVPSNALNSWLTHLAEFEEHKNWSERNLCATCHSTYPCDFATTKAKWLKGVSE